MAWRINAESEKEFAISSFSGYGILVVVLLMMLAKIDRTSAFVLLPYVAYLAYAAG